MITICVILVVIIALTGSYAIFSKTSYGNEYNVVYVGDLNFSYVDLTDEGNILSLASGYPIDDASALDTSPYRFSVENTGTLIANYKVKIIQDENAITADGCEDNLLDLGNVRYKFDNNIVSSLTSGVTEFIVHEGTLQPFESSIHELRVWLNEESPNSVLGKHFHGKVVVEVEQNNATDPYERPNDTRVTIAGKKFTVQQTDSTFPNFNEISSATNGRGIYKYQEDGVDIYYWRGNVAETATSDNNVIFAGYCWKMVRTTKTGGIKMIYNGEVVDKVTDENGNVIGGKCTNTGTATQLPETIKFNSNSDDNAYVGYMYGLTGLTTELTTPQCIKLNSAGTAAEVGTETTNQACTEAGGKWATTAYEATHANVVSSSIKKKIDTWFASSNLNTNHNLEKLEDTVYCNDRGILGSGLGYGKSITEYMVKDRLYSSTKIPKLECINQNDRFTVDEVN